jgi:KDO2-lipid IV(A) lauroyltransferase
MAPASDLPLRRRLRYGLEFIAVWCLIKLFRLLPLDAASAAGGWIARSAGPRLGVSRRAAANIQRALPEKSAGETKRIVHDMWDNLGRTAAEALHFDRPQILDDAKRFQIVGGEILETVRNADRGAIFFTAHFGNWEIIGPLFFQQGLTLTSIYRAANNPYVDRLLLDLRRSTKASTMAPKGSVGARALIAALRDKQCLGLLVDQKLNDGIAVPFFGRDAMTAPALAQLAIRFGAPIIPVHCVRITGATFRIVVEAPLEPASGGDKAANVAETIRRVNAHMEGWIRAHPAQWLWLHNRWPSD